MTALRWPLLLAEHDAAIEADCVPLCPSDNRSCVYPRCAVCTKPLSALDDARAALYRALEAERSLSRCSYLYKARDALHAAGQRAWADVAEAAAGRIGGDGRDVERLLFGVDCLVSRERHA